MDFTPYTAAKSDFDKSPDLCQLFKLISIETWKRIEHAYIKPRMKVFETTLTQNLIFTINAFSEQYGLNIETWQIPGFYDLNPVSAFPWHKLVCPNTAADLNKTIRNTEGKETTSADFVLGGESALNFFPIGTFRPKDDWINGRDLMISPLGLDARFITAKSIYENRNVKPIDSSNAEKENANRKQKAHFAPKSRIVITKGN